MQVFGKNNKQRIRFKIRRVSDTYYLYKKFVAFVAKYKINNTKVALSNAAAPQGEKLFVYINNL